VNHQNDGLMFQMYHNRHSELLEEAEQERIIRQAKKQHSYSRSLGAPVRMKKMLGRNLMRLGARLVFEPEWDEA
jgi:hypothetical protein